MNTIPTFNFTGETVLVTGSSQNLGYTIAAEFAKAGANVIVHGSTQQKAEAACQQIRSEHKEAHLEALAFDLGDEAQIDAAFAKLQEKHLMPDILVNNAAHLGLGANGFLEQTPEFFRSVMEVNLIGVLRCSQLAIADMIKRNVAGSVINISSLAGERTIPHRSAYSVSKAALDGLTRSMAVEFGPHGIRINGIVAGYIWTPRWDALTPETVERRSKNTPIGKPTQQAEIAHSVLFLSSNAAPTMTGSRIVMDSGMGIQQMPVDVYV